MALSQATDTLAITRFIEGFVASSPLNDMALTDPEPIFDAPLVGFSSGADPLYDFYKEHIGDFYWTPLSLFKRFYPDILEPGADEITVISWILPATKRTRDDNARERKLPCERWVRTRLFGERFNEALRVHVVDFLSKNGVRSLAPVLTPHWERRDHGPWAPCSNWSERHAAYAAGLGTFGLCDGLITPVGKAVRIGSVIAGIPLPPTPRPYDTPHAYCLFFAHGTCGKCIERCPVAAIGKGGHDKDRCGRYTHRTAHAVVKERYGMDTYACGLCQTGVPCMEGIPAPEMG